MTTRSDPALAEFVCLAAVRDGARHGWAIGTLLAPDGELGRIWTLSRPLTYRAIDALVERRMLKRRSSQLRQGRERALLSLTPAGVRAVDQWLDAPVDHLRDVRTVLLLKLAFLQRAGRDVRPLLAAQRERFAPAFENLTRTAAGGDLVDVWRRESARAVRRFLDAAASF